jgi:hypothetical protein
MGADNVLSFDAITVTGEYVTANAAENSDLFWALKGGGPSTFAVVTSITVKTFPEIPVAGTIININSTHTNDSKVFDQGFTIFHNLANHYVKHGMFVYFELSSGRLHIAPFVGPRMDELKLGQVLAPLFDQLDAAKIPYDKYTRAFPTFFEFYIDMFENEEPNKNSVTGGRMFTHQDIEENGDKVAEALLFASQPTTDTVGFSVGHIVDPGNALLVVDNAIHPKWRNASSFVITNVRLNGDESWEVKKQREDVQTNVVGKALRAAGPNGATYVNEVSGPRNIKDNAVFRWLLTAAQGDLYEPKWQESYWGPNYPRLLQLRKKWDPEGILYAQTTPGTEDWEVIDYGRKLCRKA